MTRTVKAIQNDTIDSLSYRYFGNQTAQYLPEILELNPHLHQVILAEHQEVLLPSYVTAVSSESLSLWD